MKDSLEDRFVRFLKDHCGAQSLDSDDFSFPPGVSKADFLVFEKTLIVELKTLISDPGPRIDEKINEHIQAAGGIPYGAIWSTQLFTDQAESDAFHNRISMSITRNTESICRNANHQLADTEKFLELHATKLLVILNESIDTLDPELVGYRVSKFLNDGTRSIDYCLLIFESHLIRVSDTEQDPIFCIANDKTTHRSKRQMRNIMKKWAVFNNVSYVEADPSELGSASYVPRKQP
jgi:hypothetical protein